jgi:hypothetical protein
MNAAAVLVAALVVVVALHAAPHKLLLELISGLACSAQAPASDASSR